MGVHKIVGSRYWSIAKRLSTAQLQRQAADSLNLSDDDFFNLDIGKRGHDYFLGFYSKAGLELVFRKYGVYKEFSRKGYKNIEFNIDTTDPYRHRLIVHDISVHPKIMLVELVVKKTLIEIHMPFETVLNGKQYETLAIEWLCMQNPKASFSKSRPRLPGQKYPGLGMASRVVELLLISAWRLNMAGLVNIPDHYHNAYLYTKIFHYINPDDEARLRAMMRDMKGLSLETVAWAMVGEAIIDKETGDPVKWFVAKQITPLDNELKALFDSKIYRDTIREQSNKYHYKFDKSKYEYFINKRRNS